MNSFDNLVGFYGKLPSHGDFLSRRLPRQFVEPWDHWLQDGISASREQLGKSWLDTFLVSPIWHFGLAPGLCGGDAWTGVMMPSVDRVGRYFPLTLAAKVDPMQLPLLFDPACGWFGALTQLAFSSLDYQFDLQAFDDGLQRLRLRDFLPALETHGGMPQAGSTRLAFHFELEDDQDTPNAFEALAEQLKQRFLANCSYWRSSVGDEHQSALLLCEGMPPIDAYVGFLNGDWPERGWQFVNCRLPEKKDARQHTDYRPISRMDQAKPVELNPGAERNSIKQSDEVDVVSAEQVLLSVGSHHRACNSYGLSVIGLRRKLNEDAILDRRDIGLWAVADGMGGHSAGDVASKALVEALAAIPQIDDLEHFSEQVASTIHGVNHHLVQLAQNRGFGHIIGSTIVVLLIAGTEFRYLWAGDSRLYRFRKGELEQLTNDHSLYNESISQGLLPLDGNLELGRGNVITRAVGADAQLQLDWGQGEVKTGDLFVLCSDGIDKELSHADIAAKCAEGSVQDIAELLVREAENRGGRDNISVIVVRA